MAQEARRPAAQPQDIATSHHRAGCRRRACGWGNPKRHRAAAVL